MASMANEFPEVTILYRDEFLVAVSKPAGLLVHRSNLDRHENRFLLQIVRNRLGQPVYPVHRLDRPTSGVMLFALVPETARQLQDSLRTGQAHKTYVAVVRGTIPEEGIIDHSLAPLQDRYSGPAAEDPAATREALTRYHRLADVELDRPVGRYPTSRYSLVTLSPLTGRRHQLRRHLKHLCHPIIGDTNYGDGRHNRFFRNEFNCRRLLLAATELILPHPATGETLSITAPLDNEFSALLASLHWESAVPTRWLPPANSLPGGLFPLPHCPLPVTI